MIFKTTKLTLQEKQNLTIEIEKLESKRNRLNEELRQIETAHAWAESVWSNTVELSKNRLMSLKDDAQFSEIQLRYTMLFAEKDNTIKTLLEVISSLTKRD